MSTGERTGAAKLKWVVIVDESLSPGQAVNAAVCVSAATAPAVPGLLGPGGPDAADIWHPGLPWAGCSTLTADSAELAVIRQRALGPLPEARDVVGVVLVAQDPDGLAAFVLQALAQDLQEELLDIVPATGPGVKLGDDMGAHDQVPSGSWWPDGR